MLIYNTAQLGVSSLQLGGQAVTPKPKCLGKVDGYFHGDGAHDKWLHIFDRYSTLGGNLPTGAAPQFCLPLQTNNGFSYSWLPSLMEFTQGIFIAVSDTETTFTQSADLMDLNVAYEQEGLSYLTTPIFHLGGATQTVFTSPGGSHVLLGLNVTNLRAVDQWVIINTGATLSPMGRIYFLPASGVLTRDFGPNGLAQMNVETDHSTTSGCYIQVVNNGNLPFSQWDQSGVNCNFTAYAT